EEREELMDKAGSDDVYELFVENGKKYKDAILHFVGKVINDRSSEKLFKLRTVSRKGTVIFYIRHDNLYLVGFEIISGLKYEFGRKGGKRLIKDSIFLEHERSYRELEEVLLVNIRSDYWALGEAVSKLAEGKDRVDTHVGDFSVINSHLDNDDLLETNEISCSIWIRVREVWRNTVKDMTTNFEKLDKFEGHDFKRWQKKMHFLLTTLKVVYVLTTPMPELSEDATVKAIRIKAKWENDYYICRGHILNGMSNSLFDVYMNVESAKELWDSLESKYMADDSSSKKFLTQHGLKMDESIYVSSIIDKLPPSWKDFKHTLKYGKDDLSLVQLGSHLHIEESLRAQDSDNGKGKEVGGPSVNMTEGGGKNKYHKQKR
nr:zinc finger, CCHC-type [Tanacetum cinerariifolium]